MDCGYAFNNCQSLHARESCRLGCLKLGSHVCSRHCAGIPLCRVFRFANHNLEMKANNLKEQKKPTRKRNKEHLLGVGLEWIG